MIALSDWAAADFEPWADAVTDYAGEHIDGSGYWGDYSPDLTRSGFAEG